MFALGQVVATPGALKACEEANQTPLEFVSKHVAGDWGIVCKEDAELNNQALKEGSRLLSAYETNNNQKIWVITEADRSATTLLLPEEY